MVSFHTSDYNNRLWSYFQADDRMRIEKWLICGMMLVFSSLLFAADEHSNLQSTSFNPIELPSSDSCQSPAQNVPVFSYMQVWQGTMPKEWVVFRLENALYKLKFYPNLPSGKENKAFTDAIKAFQKSIGTDPTGVLLVCEWVELVKRVNQLFPRFVYPSRIYPVPLKISIKDDYVEAEGTWQLQNTPVKFPFLQTSDIRCFRSANTCVEANALIVEEQDVKASVDRDYLTVEPIIWKVEIWNEAEIIANNDSYDCLRATIYVNLGSKKIYKLYRFYPGPNCDAYANKKPHIFDLVDGMNYAKGYYRFEDKKLESFYNPEYLRRLNQISR